MEPRSFCWAQVWTPGRSGFPCPPLAPCLRWTTRRLSSRRKVSCVTHCPGANDAASAPTSPEHGSRPCWTLGLTGVRHRYGWPKGSSSTWVSDVESLVRDAAALSCQGSAFLADIFGTGLLTLESMVPMVAQRRSAGRPLPFCTDLPEALFLAGGWSKASVVQPGESAANYGRLTRVPRAGETAGQGQDNLRTYLVTAVL